MDVFWLVPIVGLSRMTRAARATAKSSARFHPSRLPGLPAPVAASVVTPAIQGNCCRWRVGSVRRAREMSTKGECGSSRQVHGVFAKLSIFAYLRTGGNECRWSRFVGNVLIPNDRHGALWARKTLRMARFGQENAQNGALWATKTLKMARFVKCRCYIYMDETFTLQLARASDI
jgi:hypothetical protein